MHASITSIYNVFDIWKLLKEECSLAHACMNQKMYSIIPSFIVLQDTLLKMCVDWVSTRESLILDRKKIQQMKRRKLKRRTIFIGISWNIELISPHGTAKFKFTRKHWTNWMEKLHVTRILPVNKPRVSIFRKTMTD